MRGVATILPLAAAFLVLPPAGSAEPDAAERGRALFHDRQEGLYPSCADCHSLLPEAEEKEKAGHLGPGATLFGAASREGWRNMKTFADVGDASQKCAKAWQKRKGGLDAAQRADLVALLKAHAPAGPLPAREVQRQPKLAKDDDLLGGDAAEGKRLAERYCGGCHGEAEDALSFAFQPGKRKSHEVARKVRGYDAKAAFKPEEGTMSYYTNDRLPDAELRHILAYLAK